MWCACVLACVRSCVFACVRACVRMYVCMYVSLSVIMYVYAFICLYICLCFRVWDCVWVSLYKYTWVSLITYICQYVCASLNRGNVVCSCVILTFVFSAVSMYVCGKLYCILLRGFTPGRRSHLRAVETKASPRQRHGNVVASPVNAVGSHRTPGDGVHFVHATNKTPSLGFLITNWPPVNTSVNIAIIYEVATHTTIATHGNNTFQQDKYMIL